MHSKTYINSYAIIDNQDVDSIVFIEDASISNDDVTFALKKMFPGMEIIEIPKEKEILYDNIKYINGNFTTKPYESWIWQENGWVAPAPYPENDKTYCWNEINKEWILFEE